MEAGEAFEARGVEIGHWTWTEDEPGAAVPLHGGEYSTTVGTVGVDCICMVTLGVGGRAGGQAGRQARASPRAWVTGEIGNTRGMGMGLVYFGSLMDDGWSLVGRLSLRHRHRTCTVWDWAFCILRHLIWCLHVGEEIMKEGISVGSL